MATGSMEVSTQGAAPQMGSAVAIAAALLLGVVACAWSPALLSRMLYASCVCVALLGIGITMWRRPRWSPLLVLLFTVSLGFGLMGWQVAVALQAQLLPQDEAREVSSRGRVVGLPIAEQRRTRFQLLVDEDQSQPA
ncbi:DNA internalization-related competence protein ComEC/Rec2, partial [Xanthomonas oryzae pv. oryzae]